MPSQTTVPIIDVKGPNSLIRDDLLSAIGRVFDNGYFILGPSVEQFETELAERLGVKFAIGVNSGTDAIWLTLRALNVGHGDVVITAANTFIATVAAIAHTGATPRFVDVNDDENIDPNAVAIALTPQVKAIIAVHLRGRPAKMDKLRRVAEGQGIFLIEDASQAFGARLNGRLVGAMGTAACFSLHPQKILGACGDAGVVTTNDADLAARLRSMRNHGLEGRDVVRAFGFNSRLDPLQAEILRVKLAVVDQHIERHRQVADAYSRGLAGLPISLPCEGSEEHCVYYHYSLMADERDALAAHLRALDVDARIHYPIPIHRQVAGQICEIPADGLPKTESQVRRQLSLPIFSNITDEQVAAVIEGVRAFYRT